MTRVIPDPGFAGDTGGPDPVLDAALARYGRDPGQGREVLAALSAARLLVPVVAVLESVATDRPGPAREKDSAMATVTVVAPDGGAALLAFTSVDALVRWRADARPVAVGAPQAAQAALAEGADTLLVDASGPTAFAVSGAELRALAYGAVSTDAQSGEHVTLTAVRACLGDQPLVTDLTLETTDGPARLTLWVVPGLSGSQLRAVVDDVTGLLREDLVVRSRLPDGVTVAVLPAATGPDTPVPGLRPTQAGNRPG